MDTHPKAMTFPGADTDTHPCCSHYRNDVFFAEPPRPINKTAGNKKGAKQAPSLLRGNIVIRTENQKLPV
jgi:hypothetical protein